MFTKKNIIRKNWEFQKILSLKKQIISKEIIIYFNKSTNFKIFKIGVSIPKQFANAVMRNHYKNQIKSILRNLNLDDYKFECVLITRKTFFQLDFLKKQNEIYNLLERIKNGKIN